MIEKRMNNILKKSVYVILPLALISIVISVSMPMLTAFRAVFGLVYVLFLPGFVVSYFFFDPKETDFIERFTWSFVLSLAIVPMFLFILNKIGLQITALSATIAILPLIVVPILILFQKGKFKP